MGVDGSAGSSMLHILLNITFPALPCQVLSLDALDMSGKHEVDLHTTIFKERVDRHGLRLGKELIRDLVEGELNPEGWRSLSSAQNEASAQAIRQALEEGEGCNLHGHLVVQRVAGNFHFSVHGHPYATLQRVFAHVNEVNVSHVIHGVGFGQTYPGLINPLDGFVRMLDPERGAAGGTFKYFLKVWLGSQGRTRSGTAALTCLPSFQVVPTEFYFLKGRGISTNQYSVTEYFTPSSPADTALPAVFFLYDLSPITVSIEEKHRNLSHFLTRLCAVLGGTFALTGSAGGGSGGNRGLTVGAVCCGRHAGPVGLRAAEARKGRAAEAMSDPLKGMRTLKKRPKVFANIICLIRKHFM